MDKILETTMMVSEEEMSALMDAYIEGSDAVGWERSIEDMETMMAWAVQARVSESIIQLALAGVIQLAVRGENVYPIIPGERVPGEIRAEAKVLDN